MSKQFKLPTLLIITDNPSILTWLKKHLSSEFFVLEAATEQQALKALKTASIDFIILDAELENCQALSLSKELHLQNTLIPILLMTGRLNKTFRNRALEAGVSDFLNNALDVEDLETRIATAKKTVSLRQKTDELSTSFHKPQQQLASHYFKNRFLLHDQALRLLATAKKQKQSIVLLILQIDEFDKIQKQYGYLTADQILYPFHDFISQFLPEEDLLIPYSDGRLILLLPNLKIEQAKKVAEHLREQVQQHPFETKKGPLPLTLSIAYTSFDANEKAMNQMLEAAMKALRQAQATTNLIISIDQEIL